MIRLLFAALFDSPEGEAAVARFKEASPDFSGSEVLQIREVLGTNLAHLHQQTLTPVNKRIAELTAQIGSLATCLQSMLGENHKEVLSHLLPHGVFRSRFEEDHPAEKRELARYLMDKFFNGSPLRCFIQASTTAVHLGKEMASAPGKIPVGSLFYTNSVVFPLTVLGEQCPFSVYSFCGPVYDPFCAGWLFPPQDAQTVEHLRNLFVRAESPLSTAIVAPIITTAEDGPLFHRDETACLVNTLMSCASKVIIATTADRVRSARPPHQHYFSAKGRGWGGEGGKSVSLVISGPPSMLDSRASPKIFAARGLDVHFQAEDGSWQHCPPQPHD